MNRSTTFSKLAVVCGLLSLVMTPLQAADPASVLPPTAPRASSPAQAAQVVGITEVNVTYGRPAVKGRQVWGELVPWGEVWRTGANNATTITFTDDVTVEGQDLAAGTYGLFTVPGKKQWTVIFNRVANQWGAFDYDAADDVLRVEVEPQASDHQELFAIDFPEVGKDEAVMHIRWEKVAVPIRIGTSVTEEAMIAKARRSAADPNAHLYNLWEWTGQLLQRGITLPEMTAWVDRIVTEKPGFYSMNLKANMLETMGRTEEAITVAEQALASGAKELGKNQFLTQDQLDAFAEKVEKWREVRLATR